MAAIRASNWRSRMKFWPSALLALRPWRAMTVAQRLGRRAQAALGAQRAHCRRHADRRGHRPRIGAVLPGDVERGAMIGRGADDRQAERDVDRFLEMERLDRDQRLVVVHAQRRIVIGARARAWNMVSAGWGPVTRQPSAAKRGDRRLDDLDLLAARAGRLRRRAD